MNAILHRLLPVVLVCVAALAGRAQTVPNIEDFYVDGIHVLLQNDVQNSVVSTILFLQGGAINLRGHNPVTESYALNVPAASGPMTTSKDLYRAVTSRLFTVINADVGRDYSDMSLVCVKEYWNTSWTLFTDVLMRPRYDSVEFERIRRQTVLNINSRSANPDDYDRYLTDSVFFENHLYFNTANADDVQKITIDSIAAYHDALMIKSRMLLVVVGNISKDDLVQKIHATIGGLPLGNYVDYGFRQPARVVAPSILLRHQPLPTMYITGYFGAPKETDFDYWPTVIAASMLNSRLFDELRIRRNLTYSASAEIIGGKLCFGKVYVTTEFPDSCLVLMRQQMQLLMDRATTQTEINYHINLWITNLGQRQETNISQAEAIGRAQIVTGWWRNAYTIIDRLRELSPADIQRCAQRYFRNVNFAALGDTTIVHDKKTFLW